MSTENQSSEERAVLQNLERFSPEVLEFMLEIVRARKNGQQSL
jgi:hypothetical protein